MRRESPQMEPCSGEEQRTPYCQLARTGSPGASSTPRSQPASPLTDLSKQHPGLAARFHRLIGTHGLCPLITAFAHLSSES
jgi:hypothetical protein